MNCERCGIEFTGHKRRFCNAECREQSRDRRPHACECKKCGKGFKGSRKGQPYCSTACANGIRGSFVCGFCRKVCLVHRGGKRQNKYCTRECAFKQWSVTKLIRRFVAAHQVRFRKVVSRLANEAKREERRRILLTKTCPGCGKTFMGVRTKRCPECKPAYDKRMEKRYRISGKRRRRAQIRATRGHYRFSNIDIFERDNYVCGICGQVTDKTKQAPHPRSPSLDHKVPLAKGGEHRPWNVQCACWECNSRKSDSLPTQRPHTERVP